MAKAFFKGYALIALCTALITPARAEQAALRSPYPVLSPSLAAAQTVPPCKKPPKAIRDLEFFSVYTDRSDGLSHVDPEALKKYNEAMEPVRSFERHIDTQTRAAIVTGQEDYATCAAAWLYRWASGEAMLGTVNAQGMAVRKWTLAALVSQYIQIRDNKAVPAKQKRIIEAWFSLLAQTVRNDYSADDDGRGSLKNNHLYWAAWAAMISAVATNDRELFDWAAQQYRAGVDEIDADGTLPREMKRMGKAFNYHVFAAGPLVMMAQTAQANGVDLYAHNNGALHRLVRRIATELETDQTYITGKTGVKQNLTGTVTAGALAWLEPYNARFPDVRYNAVMEPLRPMVQRRLGGDLTLLYKK